MSAPRLPVSLARRHRALLERVAATVHCPQEQPLDEAVEPDLRRQGELVAPPPPPADPDSRRHDEAAWTSALRRSPWRPARATAI